jgi:hypothetical protein
VHVNTRDDYDPASLPIDGRLVQESLSAQLRLWERWSEFLSEGQPESVLARSRARVVMALRRARQCDLHVRPLHGSERSETSGVRLIRRLLNIELSHVALLRSGLESEAAWILILEDDADSPDSDDCADGLWGLVRPDVKPPCYINLSLSFSPRELGIDHLMRSAGGPWSGAVPRDVLSSRRPVTNTVCAIAYRCDFAGSLVAAFERMPLTPVVPIDWKLNLVLMEMFHRGEISDDDCWSVEPGPIVQMSMQPAALHRSPSSSKA